MNFAKELKRLTDPRYVKTWAAVLLTGLLLVEITLLVDDAWQIIEFPIKAIAIIGTFLLIIVLSLSWKVK